MSGFSHHVLPPSGPPGGHPGGPIYPPNMPMRPPNMPNNNNNALYVSSTISKDDTMGEESKERRILAAFTGRNRVDPRMITPGMSRGSPLPNTGPVHLAPPPTITRFVAPRSASYHSSSSDNESSNRDGSSRRNTKASGKSTEATRTNFPTPGNNTWRKRLRENRKGSVEYQANLGNVPGTKHPANDGNINKIEETHADLTMALSSIAYKSLGIDILDQNSTSTRYLAFLLDTIEKLQLENDFLQFEASQSKGVLDSTTTSAIKDNTMEISDQNTEQSQESPIVPRGQIVHRVSCAAEYHGHDGMMYEDQPELSESQGPSLRVETEDLRGERMILNEASYLQKHEDISFLVVKEHICVPRSTKSYKRSSSGSSYISPRMETLRITSLVLRRALQSVAECQLDEIIYERRGSKQPEMEAPYYFIYHHRQQLVLLSQNDPEAAAHIDALLDYVDQNYGEEYVAADDCIQNGVINSSHIRKLFKPNQIIIKFKNGSPQAYVVDCWPTMDSSMLFIEAWSWDYDGRRLVRRRLSDQVETFISEEVPIHKLPVHPLDYADPEIVSRLKARGEKFWALRRQHLVAYSGWDCHRDQFYNQEKFMIDIETYTKMHGRFYQDFRQPTRFDPWPTTVSKEAELPKDSAVLLPSTVNGFFFGEKKWKLLNVDQTHEITWNKRAFKQLVLDQGSKELLEALINTRTVDDGKKKSIIKDFVKGKGNGCIILLHGSPGTGKTLTAESVAELAEKPLYRVTCADIGTDAPKVEEYLASVLYLGQKWDCVLLLDEADVFMEERVYSDLSNNSLVSVFLRVLEYYEGILILTSNRVDNMDEAFKSRIHFALTYDRLDKESRRQIWSNFLEMLEEDEDGRADVDIPQLRGHLDSLAGRNINGRQIRSALSTAQQLAAHREERLGIKHLEQVLKNLDRFNKHLNTAKRNAGDQYTGNVSF